jgi:glyoxylase-like metal-dependent hydrolase (beta-lactamase superfamily II)
MAQEIKTIKLPLPHKMGSVNCYLLKTRTGYLLVDTGGANNRRDLEKELASAGCRPGTLKLILLTHGDFDHTGNAAYLREKFGARVAMHADDCEAVERGDITANKKLRSPLLRMIAACLFRSVKADRFKPDSYLEDGDGLSEYGIDARVLHIPGHTKGSIALVTAAGDLFCGDLIIYRGRPALNRLINSRAQAKTSLQRLAGLGIKTVYPGHGRPFPMALIK